MNKKWVKWGGSEMIQKMNQNEPVFFIFQRIIPEYA